MVSASLPSGFWMIILGLYAAADTDGFEVSELTVN